MAVFNIEVENISKKYEQSIIIRDFSQLFEAHQQYALLGANGAGKSTLLQMLYGYIQVGKGKIIYTLDGKELVSGDEASHISFAAPYLDLMDDFTAKEMLQIHFQFKKIYNPFSFDDVLASVGLSQSVDKAIRNFSSGMKQRLKLALAFFSQSEALFLDEPCTNLDADGLKVYQNLIQNMLKDRMLIIASNQPVEYEFCKHHIQVAAV
jgi:ABC-type multidrug transport system ATPase subunit